MVLKGYKILFNLWVRMNIHSMSKILRVLYRYFGGQVGFIAKLYYKEHEVYIKFSFTKIKYKKININILKLSYEKKVSLTYERLIDIS